MRRSCDVADMEEFGEVVLFKLISPGEALLSLPPLETIAVLLRRVSGERTNFLIAFEAAAAAASSSRASNSRLRRFHARGSTMERKQKRRSPSPPHTSIFHMLKAIDGYHT